jgi:uncharacterized membrane protein YgdD (TMEM256/DUF423 family)
MKNFVLMGAIYGFIGVGMGAFGGHTLKNILSPEMMSILKTGIQYQLIHACVLVLFGILKGQQKEISNWPGYCFAAGIFFFSFSLYLLAITGITKLGMITPLGGTLFLIGWLGLAYQAVKKC